MTLTKIESRASQQTLGAYSSGVGAALLSAALIAQPAAQSEQARSSSTFDVRWHTSGAINPIFYGFQTSQLAPLQQASFTPRLPAFADSWAELGELQADWDSRGAEPISREAIRFAKIFVLSVDSAFEPFAHPNGSVGLEGHKGQKSAHLIVSPEGRFAYVLRADGGVHRGNNIDADLMRQILDVLY